MGVRQRGKWFILLAILVLFNLKRMLIVLPLVEPSSSTIFGEIYRKQRYAHNQTDGYYSVDIRSKFFSHEQPSIYFIHVGKAGGMTLRQYLPIPLAEKKRELICWRKHDKNQTSADHCFSSNSNYSVLTKRIHGHFHIGSSFFSLDEQQFLMEHTNTFLYNLRNPVDRIVSAFYYHQNQTIPYPLYKKCFRTVQEMLEGLLEKNDCGILAQQVLIGNSSMGGSHFPYNYQYYERNTILEKYNRLVAVIRTEHLWQDTQELDKQLGGSGGKLEGYGMRYSHYASDNLNIAADMAVIAKAPSMLCCVLVDEIASYQRLLLKAINLTPEQKQQSLEQVLSHCGISAGVPTERPYPLVSTPFSWKEHYESVAC
eukprot:scaffold6241_cov129-Cylindrotheca_fusiformis.AAC.15